MNRKYENGFTIINKNNTNYNFNKIVIYRKAIARKKDTCIRYECYIYPNKDSLPYLTVLKEPALDEILENINK